jgi:hypothetical protein
MHPITTVIAAPDARQQGICKYHQFFEETMHGVAYCQVVLDGQQNPVDFVYLEVVPGD